MHEKILVSIPEMETAISQFQTKQARMLETMKELREAVYSLAKVCDDPSLSPLTEPFERLYGDVESGERIKQECVELLSKVVYRVKKEDADPEFGRLRCVFNAMLVGEGPTPMI